MRCPHCGAELFDGSAFCAICGKPVNTGGYPAGAYQNEQAQFNSQNANMYGDTYAPNGAYPGNGYPGDQYPVGQYPDGQYPDGGDPGKDKTKKTLIISAVALVLVAMIAAGVIFFVSGNTVSAAELSEAKEDFLPPAEVVQIDTGLDDPSNSSIEFKYDGRARVTSCSYEANQKRYDQSYSYNDKDRKLNIVTEYRGRKIFTKDIEYSQIKEAGKFKSVDGYYVRLDEKSLNDGSSDKLPSAATQKPTQKSALKATQKPTQKPTEKPTQKPTQKATQKATQKPTQKPTQKATQKPTQKATQKPTQVPTQPPTVDPTPYLEELIGVYEGSYMAAQGETGLTLTVYVENGEYKALFEFYNLPGKTNSKEGSYRMNVSYDPDDGMYHLKGYEWIDRPSSYNFVDLVGELDDDVFSGDDPNWFYIER